jgi:hypothetical protein
LYRIPYAYCYRCSYSLKYPSCDLFCARHLEDTFRRVIASEDVAAVIAEPVLGEGGFIAPPPGFFPIVMDICRKHILSSPMKYKRLRPHRGAFCLRALGTRTRLYLYGEVTNRRFADGRRYRTR